ncbi:MAG: CRTAC1 family protein [Pseudomonadota bacterium]
MSGRFRWLFVVALGSLPAGPVLGQGIENRSDVPVLQEVALEAGIDHHYTGPWEHFVGGGVAAFDCNGDRLPDLAFAGGSGEASVYVNRTPAGGAFHFERQGEALPPDARIAVTGLYPMDLDNDGLRDLVVLRVGSNALLKGTGDCRFQSANELFRYAGGETWTTAFAGFFEPGRTHPTLAFGNYVDRRAPGSPFGTCHDNVLVRPSRDEARPDYGDPQTLAPGYCALSLLATDWDNSGRLALRVSNDRQYYRGGREQLWRLPPEGNPSEFTANDGWREVRIWGMGIAEADLEGDGRPEYALTSMGDTKLQALEIDAGNPGPVYRDIAFERGATAHRPYAGGDPRPSTGWHTEFADFNNDTNLDLFIAKGNVARMPDFAAFDPDNLLLGQKDGRFVEAGSKAGIALDRQGRGAALVDLNMDGMLDLVVVNREAQVSVFRNRGGMADHGTRPMGNWLQVELQQSESNRDAVGATILARVGARTLIRKVSVGGGHASGRLGFVHFGLGTAEQAELRIRWPDGAWSAPYRVFANNFISIGRDAQDVRYWYPPALTDTR